METLAMPVTAGFNFTNSHADVRAIRVHLKDLFERLSKVRAAFFRKAVANKFDLVATLGEALFLGGEGVFFDKLVVRWSSGFAAFGGTEPHVESQKPFAFRGGVSGGRQGEQHSRDNSAFHDLSIFDLNNFDNQRSYLGHPGQPVNA